VEQRRRTIFKHRKEKGMSIEANNQILKASVVLAIGLTLAAGIFGWFFSKARKSEDSITVTGSAKKRIKSDLVVWSAAVAYQAPRVADAYKSLSESVPRVRQYLIDKGVPESEITVSSITTTALKRLDANGVETSEISGYSLRQQVEVRSRDVDRIAKIAREATELINQDILVESNAPQFFYTQLGDVKIEMLGDAARDAKTRAERIAGSTGNTIGAVRAAKMGVLQITPPDSTDVSDQGISDTSTIDKDITAVVNISFGVE
jgi:hypothetical protein